MPPLKTKSVITPQDPTTPSTNTGHPLLKHGNIADEFMKTLAARDKAKEFKIEQIEEWKKAINRLAATSDGQLFIRAMLEFSGYHDDDAVINATKMVEDKGKQAFYKRWIRPYLEKSLRNEIE